MQIGELKVTIGLPTYNRAGLLTKCVNSVLKQTYSNWELIISDDNSSDETQEVAHNLMKLDDRIRYFRHDVRVFLPFNRNTICSMATSAVVLFIEDDLILDKNCLNNLTQAYQELSSGGKLGAVTPRMITVGNDLKRSDPEDVVKVSKWTGLVQGNFGIDCDKRKEIVAGHSCSLIAKQAWEEVGGYDGNRYRGTNFREETDFYFRMKQKDYKIYFEPKAVVYHFPHKLGGCHSSKWLSDDYYYARNHILFLLRFYGLKATYMIPLFGLYLTRKLIKR